MIIKCGQDLRLVHLAIFLSWTFATHLLMETQCHAAWLASVGPDMPLHELLECLDASLSTKTGAQRQNEFVKCTQDQGMMGNCFAEKIVTGWTLAFREEWSDAFNELTIGVFCNGLLDSSMAEYVR